jgi:hypothetical protein
VTPHVPETDTPEARLGEALASVHLRRASGDLRADPVSPAVQRVLDAWAPAVTGTDDPSP